MHTGRNLLRPLALAAGVAFLTATTCESDNLGKGRPGPTSFRVSIATNTVPANAPSSSGTISADGRYVCFASTANNLANPNSSFKEIFRRDRWTDTIENVSKLASVDDPNTQADCQRPYMSSSGNYVVFESKGELAWDISSGTPENFPGVLNIFLVDLTVSPPSLTRIPESDELNQDCTNASVSDDGRYIAFTSMASNVPGITNSASVPHVYVYDNSLNQLTLISHSTGGATTIANRKCEFPRISANGAFVAFESTASDLTSEANLGFVRRVYVAANDGTGMELVSRGSTALGTPADEQCNHASISADGRYVAFVYAGGTAIAGAPVDPDFLGYVIRRDRDPGSLTSSVMGTRVFVFGTAVGTTAISNDGLFASYLGINLAGTDLQVFVGQLGGPAIPASRHILAPGSTLDVLPDTFLSADGRWAVWDADTPEEVLGDTNGVTDVFGYGPIR